MQKQYWRITLFNTEGDIALTNFSFRSAREAEAMADSVGAHGLDMLQDVEWEYVSTPVQNDIPTAAQIESEDGTAQYIILLGEGRMTVREMLKESVSLIKLFMRTRAAYLAAAVLLGWTLLIMAVSAAVIIGYFVAGKV
jgi:hypothetical protein